MFSKLMDKKYQMATILSLCTGLAGCYYYFTKKSNKNNNKNQNNHSQSTDNINQHGQIPFDNGELMFQSKSSDQDQTTMQKWSSLYSQFYFDKNLSIRKVLDNLDSHGISVQTIYKYSPLIALDQYKKFTQQIRRRRRLIRTYDEDQYIQLIMDYEQQVDQLLERTRQQIIYQCEMDPDDFSNMKVIFQATQDLPLLMRQAKKSLKNNHYIQKRPIPKTTLQKILTEEISFIKSKLYERVRNKLQNEQNLSQDQILRVIQAYIEDIVYEKYGYEKEQIEQGLTGQWKAELGKEIKELKKCRLELESDIGNINILSQESEAESQKQREPLSQGLTRSGVNSSFHEDEDNLP